MRIPQYLLFLAVLFITDCHRLGLTVNGNTITVPTGSDSYGAIDTGTTLVSGPEDVVASLYQQIPDSEALSGQNKGFYQYRASLSLLPPLPPLTHALHSLRLNGERDALLRLEHHLLAHQQRRLPRLGGHLLRLLHRRLLLPRRRRELRGPSMDRRRHLPQERLLRLPRQPRRRRLRPALLDRARDERRRGLRAQRYYWRCCCDRQRGERQHRLLGVGDGQGVDCERDQQRQRERRRTVDQLRLARVGRCVAVGRRERYVVAVRWAVSGAGGRLYMCCDVLLVVCSRTACWIRTLSLRA